MRRSQRNHQFTREDRQDSLFDVNPIVSSLTTKYKYKQFLTLSKTILPTKLLIPWNITVF